VAEYDLEIKYKPGRCNCNANALSRSPLPCQGEVLAVSVEATTGMPSADQLELRELQQCDLELRPLLTYLQKGILPEEKTQARRTAVMCSELEIVDNILYYVDKKPNNRKCIVVPKCCQDKLMQEAHAGSFAGHFAAKGMYDSLSRLYRWEGMYSDINKYCHRCLACAAYKGTGHRHKAPLQLIPVGEPFDRVGVDILEMPQTSRGTRYIIVFMQYLMKWMKA